MNASKENAAKARDILSKSLKFKGDQFLKEFLAAAERKLPSEGAYAKARKAKNDR